MDDATIGRYANVLAEGIIMPPIRVAEVAGAMIVVDGWHRLAASERRGINEIEAEIIKASTSEAAWMAASANLTHGLPLKRAEIRTAFRAMIRARKHISQPGTLRSYRELAGVMGGLVRHTTLRNWMMKDFPEVARRMANEDHPTGSPEAVRDEDGVFSNAFHAALATAEEHAPIVRDPRARGIMIAATERLLKVVLEDGPWAAIPEREF